MKPQIYKGSSADVKPLHAPLQSIFIEEDTDEIYVKNSSSRTNNGWEKSAISLTNIKTDLDASGYAKSSGTTGGVASAGAGNQYVELEIGGVVYKVLHDGTV